MKQILNPHNSTQKKRLVWLAVLLFCIGAFLFQLSGRIFYYLSEPTSNHIIVNENDSFIFPHVSICPSVETTTLLTVIGSYIAAYGNKFPSTEQGCPNISTVYAVLSEDKETVPIDMNDLWEMLSVEKSGITVSVEGLTDEASHQNNKNYIWRVFQTYTTIYPRMARPECTTNATEQNESLDVGIPGIKQILNPHTSKWKRLSWFIVLVACFAAVVYQLTDRISYYLSEPTSTYVAIKENDSFLLPFIHICPSIYSTLFMSGMVYTHLAAFGSNITDNYRWCLNDSNVYEGEPVPVNMTLFWELLTLDETGVKVYSEHTYYKEVFGTKQPLAIKVKETEVPWSKCLTINIVDPITIYGLTTVTIKINIFELLPTFGNFWECSTNWYVPDSFVLSIALNEFDVPQPYGYDINEFFNGMPGQEIVYYLSRREFFYVHTSKRPCERDWFRSYSAYEKCMQKEFISWDLTCNTPFVKASDERRCETNSLVIQTIMTELLPTILKNTTYKKRCGQMEIALCRENKFTAEYKYIKDLESIHTLTMHFIIPDQFFQIVREEFTYLLPSLISDIGGSLGIFLGVCVLTVIEIVDAIFCKLQIKIKKFCCKK